MKTNKINVVLSLNKTRVSLYDRPIIEICESGAQLKQQNPFMNHDHFGGGTGGAAKPQTTATGQGAGLTGAWSAQSGCC